MLATHTAYLLTNTGLQDERGKTDSVTVDLRFDSAVEQLVGFFVLWRCSWWGCVFIAGFVFWTCGLQQINIDHCAVNFVPVPATASNTFSGGYTVSVRVEVTHSGDRLLRNVAG